MNRKKHYARVHALWSRACLGLKIRTRICKRRLKVHWSKDEIGKSLHRQCNQYYKLMCYLKPKVKYHEPIPPIPASRKRS